MVHDRSSRRTRCLNISEGLRKKGGACALDPFETEARSRTSLRKSQLRLQVGVRVRVRKQIDTTGKLVCLK
ncbi:hypothetical protein DF3PB_30035 [uncultured Defluviicoccus sp.]|uniref:Uncharacterized protein n=1 Tax=metagenome TaxID=256318 RepID=A0A380TDM9_9ZZZZ|nr:hypothetical protein DF3PB_30035 [uncultured Defluviicoccus sp.]